MKHRARFAPLLSAPTGVEVRRNWEFERQAGGAWLFPSTPQCPFRG